MADWDLKAIRSSPKRSGGERAKHYEKRDAYLEVACGIQRSFFKTAENAPILHVCADRVMPSTLAPFSIGFDNPFVKGKGLGLTCFNCFEVGMQRIYQIVVLIGDNAAWHFQHQTFIALDPI